MRRTTSAEPAAAHPARRWPGLSWGRIVAVLLKEFVQLRRDRLTFAMMVGVPIMQLVLFGYAINSDPRNLPTAVVALDNGPLVRAVVRAAENTGYFKVVATVSDSQAEALIGSGQVQFALVFPADFSARLLRGEKPDVAVPAPHVVVRESSGPVAAGRKA